MKKILSQSPFFLVFFGILGYLIYNANFDKKMTQLDEKIEEYCIGANKSADFDVEDFYACTKRKWEEIVLYEKYVNWKVSKNKLN